MNKAILMGRLTKDPELRSTQSNLSVCSFTVACDRRFKNQDGSRTADFIPCVAWRQQAEFINRYFKKGDRILVTGTIQTRSWDDQNGQKRYITEVIIEEVEFCESRRSQDSQGGYQGHSAAGDYSQTATVDKNNIDQYLSDDGEDDTALPFEMGKSE